ncbi:hypothetical protein EWM64_g2273 [Hericium alpestre]|uniref:Uncharacterized protein n=1 Tax=Hericium alpestre TaxID=135208 RepID=A0A4Z0A665_9AGAM|nr:hypothetical protein EWM64_g2273 [Hericium alpestre]
MRLSLAVVAAATLLPTVLGGPIAYGLCQTGAVSMDLTNAEVVLMGEAHLNRL